MVWRHGATVYARCRSSQMAVFMRRAGVPSRCVGGVVAENRGVGSREPVHVIVTARPLLRARTSMKMSLRDTPCHAPPAIRYTQ